MMHTFSNVHGINEWDCHRCIFFTKPYRDVARPEKTPENQEFQISSRDTRITL